MLFLMFIEKLVSIKNAERKKRNTVPGTQFKNICAGHIIQQWRRFLGEDTNKTALISFLVSEWQEEVYRTKLQSKILYVTCEDQCYKITPQHVEIVDDLKCTHEEADTRLLLHAKHASKNSYMQIGNHSVRRYRCVGPLFSLPVKNTQLTLSEVRVTNACPVR